MDFPALTHPERLWWLALLPVLWWLSRPHRPPRGVTTPHLTQWLRARAQLGRQPVRFPWRRFLLAALALLAATVAFGQPTVGARRGPTSLAVLLDTSASMAAGAVGAAPTAWERAVGLVRRQLAALPPHVDVRLALCGTSPRVCVGTAAELLAALPVAPAGPGGVDLAGMAARLSADAGLAVWTVTDGLGSTALPVAGALNVVGAAGPNVGLTGIEVEDAWPLPDITVTVEVTNYLGRAADLTVAAEGGVESARATVHLGAGAHGDVALSLRRTTGGELRVRVVGAEDQLELDDAVVVELPAPAAPDIAVLLDAAATPARAAEVHAAVESLAVEAGGRVVDHDVATGASFLLVEGGVLPRGTAGRALTFGTRSGTDPLEREALVVRPRVVDWDRSDPVTRGLDLSELQIDTCLRSDFLGSGKPLVRAEHGPVVVVDDHGESASIHVAFRLSDSNFGLLTAFPQFLRRAFARTYRQQAAPSPAAGNLVSAAESRLAAAAGPTARQDRPLPEFGAPGRSLVLPLLLVALVALAVRVHV